MAMVIMRFTLFSPNQLRLCATISSLTFIMLLLSAIVSPERMTNALQYSYYCCVSRFYDMN